MLLAVHIELAEPIRANLGTDHLVAAGTSVRDLLDDLEASHPTLRFWDDHGQLSGAFRYRLNGTELALLGGVDAILHEGDTLSILSSTPTPAGRS